MGSVWGGSESLLAISEMLSVNVIIFNERGSYYFPNGFDSQYNKFIFLAYRLSKSQDENNINYNHYDSVCEIDQELLYKCVCDLSKVAFNMINDEELEKTLK